MKEARDPSPARAARTTLLTRTAATSPPANTGYDGDRAINTLMSAKRSSGGSPTIWTSPGQRGRTPTPPSTATRRVRATNRPEGGALCQDSRRGRLRQMTPLLSSNPATLAYDRAVQLGPPDPKPTSDPVGRMVDPEPAGDTDGRVATRRDRTTVWTRL